MAPPDRYPVYPVLDWRERMTCDRCGSMTTKMWCVPNAPGSGPSICMDCAPQDPRDLRKARRVRQDLAWTEPF